MCTGKKRIKVKLCVQEKRIEDVLYLTNFFFKFAFHSMSRILKL